jgi:GT2 family glycosyltransferase
MTQRAREDTGTMPDTMDVSVIIVNWNTRRRLLDCLASLYRTTKGLSFEVIVVDNASTDASVEAVTAAFPAARIIVNSVNAGFAKANNAALRQMQGRYALLLNSDTIVTDSAVAGLLAFMEQNPEAGVCGPQLLNSDGSLELSVGEFPTFFTTFVGRTIVQTLFPATYRKPASPQPSGAPLQVDCIIGACMMVRKTAIDAVGMLDEEYFFLYEDTDWCYRMVRAGWSIYFLPQVRIVHVGRQSIKEIKVRARVEAWRSCYLFFRKDRRLSHGAWLALLLTGFLQNAWQFLVYSMLNTATLFLQKRLRRRWYLFAYLLLWHLRGRPESMGIPRAT